MLVGGTTPIANLIAMIRASPAPQAARLLVSLPADRLDALLDTVPLTDLADALAVMEPDGLATILASARTEQIAALVRVVSTEQGVRHLSALPAERMLTVVYGLPVSEAARLLETMPPGLLNAVAPHLAGELRAAMYVRQVTQALTRANVKITGVFGARGDALLVEVCGSSIMVVVHHYEEGAPSTADLAVSEEATYRTKADGALAVSNMPMVDEVIDYRRNALRAGRLVNAVTWADRTHDGILARELVALLR